MLRPPGSEPAAGGGAPRLPAGRLLAPPQVLGQRAQELLQGADPVLVRLLLPAQVLHPGLRRRRRRTRGEENPEENPERNPEL